MASIETIKRRNANAGHHWFSPDTLRFFSSRVLADTFEHVDGRTFFVSSERRPGDRRRYTVRVAMPDGPVHTVGEFQAFASRSGALATARRAASTA
jgi:hypothetical protein